MENKLLMEVSRIKSMMNVNENKELLIEGIMNNILSKLISKSVATTEEKLLLKFFEKDFTKQITTETDKIAFSNFIKSKEGKTFITKIEKEISKLSDDLERNSAERSLDKLKQKAKDWEKLGTETATSGTRNQNITKKFIRTNIENLESSYPNLFKKKWYGSFVHDGRIKNIENRVIREFEGKSAKGIEDTIEGYLSKADRAISNNKSLNTKQKSFFKKLITKYGDWLVKNPVTLMKSTAAVIPIAILSYLVYDFGTNWYQTGSPISGAMVSGSNIWSDIKKGYQASKSQPNSITTESQLREKYPCVNQEVGVKFSPIVNNKTVVTFADGSSYELTIKGDKVTYTQDGSEIC